MARARMRCRAVAVECVSQLYWHLYDQGRMRFWGRTHLDDPASCACSNDARWQCNIDDGQRALASPGEIADMSLCPDLDLSAQVVHEADDDLDEVRSPPDLCDLEASEEGACLSMRDVPRCEMFEGGAEVCRRVLGGSLQQL